MLQRPEMRNSVCKDVNEDSSNQRNGKECGKFKKTHLGQLANISPGFQLRPENEREKKSHQATSPISSSALPTVSLK